MWEKNFTSLSDDDVAQKSGDSDSDNEDDNSLSSDKDGNDTEEGTNKPHFRNKHSIFEMFIQLRIAI